VAAWRPDPGQQVRRAEELRKQACAVIEGLARTEEEVARIHEELAVSQPGHRDEYRRAAEHARQTARNAREALRSFTD
jgi:hypothetical protein